MDPTYDIDGIIVGPPAKQLNHAKIMQSRWDPPIYMEGIVVGPKTKVQYRWAIGWAFLLVQ